MAEPFIPKPDRADDEATTAAEPGPAGPPPEQAEESDVVPGNVPEPDVDSTSHPNPLFRRPAPGERLHPDELAREIADEDFE